MEGEKGRKGERKGGREEGDRRKESVRKANQVSDVSIE